MEADTEVGNELTSSPSRGFLDLRSSAQERKKHTVPRRTRKVLVVGLDGAGKTRLCSALSQPCDATVASTRTVPTDLFLEVRSAPDAAPCVGHDIDDRWLVKKWDGPGFPTGPSKVPPTTRIELFDVSGAASHRVLWSPFADGSLPLEDGESNAPPDAIVGVISAHDPSRLALAWSELLAVVRTAPSTPVAVVVARVRESAQVMTGADVLKSSEDFAPIPRDDDTPWTVTDVDLRPVEEKPGDSCMYEPQELRRLVQWLLQNVR